MRRMYDEEDDLNTIVFMNADTTRTKYYFGHPVKYVDENGVTKDISLNIVSAPQSANAYMTEANSITSAFSRTLSDGVSLSNGNVSVTLVPTLNNADSASSVYALRNNAQAQLIDNKTVSYYYDEKTTIEYKLTYTGFKEDIIVSEYTGQTEYDFTLYTNGLYLTCIDGSYYLLDDNDTVRATLGDIIIFTADERNNTMGRMSSVTVREGYEYELTIHVDADFLADERTVYPIRIDPTVEITDNDPIGAMEDVLIRQNYTYTGSFGSSYIGRFTDGTLSRLLVRFPYLNFNTLGTNSTFITSATIELRDLMCSGVEDMYIDCHIYNMSSPSWSESSGATWTSVGNSYVGTLLDSHLVSYGKGNVSTDYNRYSFDITEAAKMWANGTQSPQKGLVFKASSSFENQTGSDIKYWRKTFASYNRAEYKPSFTLTFTKTDSSQILSNDTYYINNLQEGKYIKRNGAYALGESGLLANLGTSIQFRVEKADVGYIIKSASDPTQLLSGVQSMPYVNFVVPSSADIPTTAKWDISYSAETGVLIKNLANNCYLFYTSSGLQVTSLPSSTNENYSLFCWRAIKTSAYGNTSQYTHREPLSISMQATMVAIREPVKQTISSTPTNAIWISNSDFTYSSSDDTVLFNKFSDEIYGKKLGIALISATHKVTGKTTTFLTTINPLTIYEHPRAPGKEENGNTARDMHYSDMARSEIMSLSGIAGVNIVLTDLLNTYDSPSNNPLLPQQGPPALENYMRQLSYIFTTSDDDMTGVADEMIEHFLSGSGTSYSNDILTNRVREHSATIAFVSSTKQLLINELIAANGDLYSLSQSNSDYKNAADEISAPAYNTTADYVNGLKICLNGIWGYYLEITEFNVTENTFDGKLKYVIYDHFGLDTNDLSGASAYSSFLSYTNQFGSWFILQRYENCAESYKPFITYIEFEESFGGTLDE